MTAAAAEALLCRGCGQGYPTFVAAPGVRYVCLRCDATLLEPERPPGEELLPTSVYAYPDAVPLEARLRRQPLVRNVGRYQVRAEIGRGGMGVVYRAMDPDLGREVAIKVLIAADHSTPEHVDRFVREARAAARADHPNLVRVHDIGWADGVAYFTMELVTGPSLQQVLDRRSKLPPAEVARIGAALARALAAAHERGLVHRDVKPGNVLFRTDGTPLLADFGLATQAGDARLTRTGQLMGTPAYLAPERTRGHASAASDQYALGALVYEALCGKAPYAKKGTAQDVVYALAEGPPKPLSRVAPSVPAELVVVVEMAMDRDPTRRYPSCRHLAEDLERWLRGERVEARPPPLWRRAATALQRRRAWLGLGATLIGTSALVLQGVSTLHGVWARDVEERREAEAERALKATARDAADRVAAGDVDGARDRLLDLARSPQHTGTAAAARAWIDAAELLSQQGRGAEALDLWAAGWVAARNPVDQDDALRGLEHQFREEWRWPSLLRVLEHHAAMTPATVGEPRTAALRADALLGLREVEEAAAQMERAALPGAALARHLSVAAPIDLEGDGRIVDADGDGVPEWWAIRSSDGALVRTRLVPGLPWEVLGAVDPSEGRTVLHVVPGDPPLVLVWGEREGQLRVVEPRDGGLVEVYRTATSVPVHALRLDDGSVRVALGPYDRDLLRLSREGGHFAHDLPSPAVDAPASDVLRLALADLDADGARELVVARGAWTAYDLSVWRGAPDGPSAAPLARRKLGTVEDLVVVPGAPDRVWALHTEAYPSAVLFPEQAPYGEPVGAYLLGLSGGRLVGERFLPTPGPSGVARHTSHLVVADLDGDGLHDLAYALRAGDRQALVVHPGAEEGTPLVIGDVTPLGAAQLDGDPALELLVLLGNGAGRRPTPFVLGSGAEPLPTAPRSAAPHGVPEELGAEARPAWTRAEDLVSMGLVDAGARELGRLADVWRGQPDGVVARRRQAALLADDPERSASLLEEAAADGGGTGDRLAAAEGYLRAHRFEDAQRVLAPASDDEAARSLLHTFADELADSHGLSIGAGALPAEVVLGDPLGLSRDPDGTLRLEALVGGPDALVAPFELVGGRLGFTARLGLERVEWGSGLSLELRGPGGERVHAWVRALGGGGLLHREFGCRVGDHEPVTLLQQVRGANEPSEVELAVDVSETRGEWRCAVRVGDRLAVGTGPVAEPLARGSWALGAGPLQAGLESRGQVIVVLRALDLVGTFTPRPPLETAEPLRRWLGGDLPEVPPPGHEVQHAAALADLGRTDEAVVALRALPESALPVARARAAEVLRTRLATFGPVVREAWGDGWLVVFEDAYSTPIHSHHGDEEIRAALTTGLQGLEARLPHLRGEDQRRGALLLLARGRAWSELGQPGAALRDLQQATAALLPALETEQGGRSLSLRIASAWLDHAVLAAARGDAASALEAIRRAREVTQPPELADDLMAARPALRLIGR